MPSTDPAAPAPRPAAWRAALAAAPLAAALLLPCLPAAAAPPLSANDWLSGGPAPPPVSAWRPGDVVPPDAGRARDATRRPLPAPKDRAGAPIDDSVGVTRLDGPDADRAGTLSPAAASLSPDLWRESAANEIAAALSDSRPRLPASVRLLRRLLLAQLEPPRRGGEDAEGALFLARVDRLIGLGAVDAAAALLDSAGPSGPGWTGRRFDAALLLGQEARACEVVAAAGAAAGIGPRVFCLVRAGDWDAAALTLAGAQALGEIDAGLATRLAAYLDDAGADGGEAPPAPERVTPLDYRLLAAVGQPLPTAELPPAFAWADLGGESGWKMRLDAAERLARLGSLSGARLRAIYLEEPPAASGGVWDRVAAIQALDAALHDGDEAGVAAALPRAAEAMAAAGLTPPLAEMLAGDVAQLNLPGEAGRLALRLALSAADLLPPQAYEGVAAPADPRDAWMLAAARGDALPAEGAPQGGFAGGIAAALTGGTRELPPGAPGLALLAAMADADAGLDGDGVRAARGIAALRALGLERVARGAALQLLLGPGFGGAR